MSRPRTLLVLIDLVQDLDVLLPVLERLRDAPGWRLDVVVSGWLAARAPRIPARLRTHGLAFRRLPRPWILSGWAPRLGGVEAVLTGAESSAGPHRWAHALVRRASARGIRSFSVQHGLDNIAALAEGRSFASDILFAWPPPSELPDTLDLDLRARIVCVGRPMPAFPAEPPRFDVGLFENLHARSYDAAAREAVRERILAVVAARPNLGFYIRSHPAGGWLDRIAARLEAFPNVTYVRAEAARRSTAPGSFAAAAAARVITTPSTVALDAAMARRPVALALDGGPPYAPLPVLPDLEQWLAFVDAPAEAGEREAAFLARSLLAGDAAARIAAQVTSSVGNSVRPKGFDAIQASGVGALVDVGGRSGQA